MSTLTWITEKEVGREIKKKEETNFVHGGGEKMRKARGHQVVNEWQRQKSELEHIQHFLHKTCNQEVSGKIPLWSCKTTAKKCMRKCVARAKLLSFFAN